MLRVHLDRGGEPEDFRLVGAGNRREDRLAPGERPGLVEDDDVELPRPLERDPILDEQAVARPQGGADGDDQRDREAESVRAGDHEDRREAGKGAGLVAVDPPEGERDHPARERDIEQDRGSPIRERLRPRGRCLGRRHHAHDPRQGRPLPDRGHPDPQAAAGGNRPGHDLRPGCLGHGLRLTGDHRFVDVGRALGDDPVGRHAGAGSDQHHVPQDERVERHRLRSVLGHSLGGIGQQLGEGRKGAAGLGNRAHLEPVAQQHDGDQRGQLPPDLDLEQAERPGPAGHEGDDDRQADQGHHRRLPVGKLAASAPQEDEAAV